MHFIETELKDAFIIDLQKFEDNRGFFARTWAQDEFEKRGLDTQIMQTNLSYNHTRGTLRGMHFRRPPYGETKLVRCVRGAVYDIIIDIRPESPTYKRWVGVELSAENRRALYVPKGFAHGFQTLEDHSEVMYQVSQHYMPSAEDGIGYNDPIFDLQWPLPVSVISEKDTQWPAYQG